MHGLFSLGAPVTAGGPGACGPLVCGLSRGAFTAPDSRPGDPRGSAARPAGPDPAARRSAAAADDRSAPAPAGRGSFAVRRLLYVGDLKPGTTSRARGEALEDLGVPLGRFDSTDVCRSASRLVNYLGHRVYCTPRIWTANRELRRQAQRERPDVVWIDKGRWIFPGTLRALRAGGARIIHYNTDDLFGTEEYLWLHRLGWKYLDLALTTNRWNVLETTGWRGVPSFRCGMGYDHRIHFPPSAPLPPGPDLVFIGHYEPHTEDYLAAAADAGIRVEVHGGQWWRARRREFRPARLLPNAAYNAKIASAGLALCSLSRRNRNESTGRSLEIPAIGGCLVAEDTLEHRWLYRDGEEAVFFRSAPELVDRCRTLLADRAQRDRIARRGHARCRELGLSWRDHLAREWPLCQAFLATGRLDLTPAADEPFWPGFRRGATDAADPAQANPVNRWLPAKI